MTDPTESYPGTLILVNHGSRTTWHHSVSFDGREHGTACGQGVGPDPIDEVCLNIEEWDHLDGRSCDECAGSVRSLASGTDRSDGGNDR